MTGTERMLTALFQCGTEDLRLLNDVQYDWEDVFDFDEFGFDGLNINYVMRRVFEIGFGDILEARDDRICELEAIPNERELDEDEEEELRLLRNLKPYEDFSSYHNFLDTHVYCDAHGATYKNYLSDALDRFEEDTGFYISFLNDDK